MSDIPSFPYAFLWGEWSVVSVANLTREDGTSFMRVAAQTWLEIGTTTYALGDANQALTATFVAEHVAKMVDVGTGLVEEQATGTATAAVAMATLEDTRALFEQCNVRGLTRTIDAYGEDVVTILCRAAEECETVLVIMGTHGRHGIGRMLLGSVAEAFLRRAGMPVLLVRRERDMDEIPSYL